MIYQFQGFLSSRHFKQFIQEFNVKAILKPICQKFSTIEQNDNYQTENLVLFVCDDILTAMKYYDKLSV